MKREEMKRKRKKERKQRKVEKERREKETVKRKKKKNEGGRGKIRRKRKRGKEEVFSHQEWNTDELEEVFLRRSAFWANEEMKTLKRLSFFLKSYSGNGGDIVAV